MIRPLCAAEASRWIPAGLSRQKKNAIFTLAARITRLAERARLEGIAVLSSAAIAEPRKVLREGFRAAALGGDAARIELVLAQLKTADNPVARIEFEIMQTGLFGIISGMHPYLLMLRMSARLGVDYFEKAQEWIIERTKRRRPKAEELVVPGELPDVIRLLALDGRSLERSLHAAGLGLSAAALAGCPHESIALAKPCFGAIGGAMLEDEAVYLRSRLSGEEIAQAQAAFMEILRGMQERRSVTIGNQDDLVTDPAFVAELTKTIGALDQSVLKKTLPKIPAALLSTAMQGMEPRAHNRILGSLTKKTINRLLDAIDEADPLPGKRVVAAGEELAERLLGLVEGNPQVTRSVVERLIRLRDWENRSEEN